MALRSSRARSLPLRSLAPGHAVCPALSSLRENENLSLFPLPSTQPEEAKLDMFVVSPYFNIKCPSLVALYSEYLAEVCSASAGLGAASH